MGAVFTGCASAISSVALDPEVRFCPPLALGYTVASVRAYDTVVERPALYGLLNR